MEHIPVLLQETLEYLAVKPEGVYLDASVGLGGHTAAIASRLTTGWVIANDLDAESLELARRNTAQWAGRIRFHQGRFSELKSTLRAFGVQRVDGLLADLGASRFQLLTADRGLSLSVDGPLDMRLDRSRGITASDLINTRSEREIGDLLFRLAGERRARRIARAIVRARPIASTSHLARVVEAVAPRTRRLHPATLTFLGLRRAVNREAEELEALLELAPEVVASGGRVVVISFMSLEDRVVKQSFRDLARQGRAVLLTKHVVTPSEQEVRSNPASRSAKLRALAMN
jgi:16S rRNA (cytosine1402-N4)-methyltransferase